MWSRFWAKVNKSGPIPAHRPELGQCWIWTAAKTKRGYGKFRVQTARSWVPAHVFAYCLVHGGVPNETLDHLCKNPSCVRESHLEPVSRIENTMRSTSPPALNAQKTQCPKGHLYSGENLRIAPKTGYRICRLCAAERSKAQNAARPKKGKLLKFSSRQVTELRQAYSTGRFTQAVLAEQFGMSKALVSLILNEKIRKVG